MRAGTRTLSAFGYALNATVLRAHASGPLRRRALEREHGWAPATSLRVAVTNLCELGALSRAEPKNGSRDVVAELTEAGRELLGVLGLLERWLGEGPGEGLTLDHPAARGVVKALISGWDSAMLATLAQGPHTLNELSAGIPGVSYPALKRRLDKLRSTGLVVPVDDSRIASYTATDWLRRAVGPLAAAARWELAHDSEPPAISCPEAEAALLLALPLARIPRRVSGRCTLAVIVPSDDGAAKPQVATVAAEVERGNLVSCAPGHGPEPDTWAFGRASSWLDALLDGDVGGLRVNGAAPDLVRGVVRGMSGALYGG